MKKSIFTFIILLQANLVFGQFTDTFSDGNFTANPAWSGDIGNFEVDSFSKLHLNDSIANTSSLSTPSQAIINGSWDGISEDVLQLNTGMYIVWMGVFSDDGDAKRFKEVIVLSR